MSRRSVVLLTNPPQLLNATGEPVRADEWYGQTQHLYTVAIHTSAFIGSVHIEGTLVREPEAGDWFAIIPPVVYDQDSYGYTTWDVGGTHNTLHTFKGNFAWIRARMSRPISEEDAPLFESSPGELYGSVDRVLLNM